MQIVRWGIVGCGEVTEVKSGPALQKADGSALVAVMRRDRAKAEDFARRHGVPRAYTDVDALLNDPDVDAVYVATPPSSHCELAIKVADAGKPCLVEKPMALDHPECVRMLDAFGRARVPLWVAYYRRALPRFLRVQELLAAGAIGRVTSVHVDVRDRLASGARADNWRYDPAISGAGLFMDLASHCFDLLDFLVGRVAAVSGFAVNTGGTYAAEDATVAAFQFDNQILGTGVWNFHADAKQDAVVFIGSDGELRSPIFADDDVMVSRDGRRSVHAIRNPPHVHQPLIQTIVDELRGRGRCASTGDSAAHTSWVMDRCVAGYYAGRSA